MKCPIAAQNDLACIPNGHAYEGYKLQICHGDMTWAETEPIVEEPVVIEETPVEEAAPVEEAPVEEVSPVEETPVEEVAPVATEEPVEEVTPVAVPVDVDMAALQACASTSPRQCENSGACKQNRCPLSAPSDLACLPHGSQF